MNFLLFYEIRSLVDESLYREAYAHYLIYTSNRNYKGDEHFYIQDDKGNAYRIFVFKDPSEPLKDINVSVSKPYVEKLINDPIKRIFFAEFLTIFSVILVYQLVIDNFLRKIHEQEEWTKSLIVSIAHKFGNFLSVQKVNLSLLKSGKTDGSTIRRIERSLSRVEKDMNLFLNILKEEKHMKKEWIRADRILIDLLKDFEEDMMDKRLIAKLSEVYVYADSVDLMDIFFNLISNSIKHSKSFVQIRMCKTNEEALFVFRNDMSSASGGGMGVGNVLLSKVVERQGGKLSVRIKKYYTAFLSLKGR
ncbi:MAG: sensor histidine kinase [Aquificaceae bacterium]